jgi:ATP-binding cassette, subfamily B, bacterial
MRGERRVKFCYNLRGNQFMIRSVPLKQALTQTLRLDRALRLVWKSAPGWMLANAGLVIAQGLLPLAGLYVVRQIVDTVTAGLANPDKQAAFQQVLFWLLLAAGIGILTALARSLGELASQAQAQLVTDHVSDLLHAQSIAVDLEYYENPSYYDTMHRAQAEAPYRPTSIVNGLVQLAQNAITLVGVVGLFLAFSPLVGIVMLLAALPGAFVRWYYARQSFRFEEEQAKNERKAWYYHWVLTDSSHAKEVRLFNLGQLFKGRNQDLRQALRQGRLALAGRRSTADFIVQALAALAIFGVLGLAAYQTLLGRITLGDLTAIYLGFQIGLSSLQAILRSLAGLYEDNLFLSHFYQFLDLQPIIRAPLHPEPIPDSLLKGVSFKGVSFSYPNSSREALAEVDLALAPGQVIALVGANGSGKTTLVKLLCELYYPTNGQITVDGIDMRQIDPVAWRRRISVVFQDYVHYHLTARENIWLGNIDQPLEPEAVELAARQSGADQVIQGLPQGYDTYLGTWFEDGKEISGGEWQKIALARAFLRDAQIIVLDEPTSSLDPLAEEEVFRQFRQLLHGKSAILISHRFSTVQMADFIYVLEQGRILEKGTHAELLARNGRYAEFYQVQAAHYQA